MRFFLSALFVIATFLSPPAELAYPYILKALLLGCCCTDCLSVITHKGYSS
ncbi:exported hypothetical protein [Photobacterium kishitanii]|nr:exported hypothetical protein [Photobacterium kishitanii]